MNWPRNIKMSQLIAKGLSKRLQLFIDMNSSGRWRRMRRAEERKIQKNKTHTINSFIKYANRATLFFTLFCGPLPSFAPLRFHLSLCLHVFRRFFLAFSFSLRLCCFCFLHPSWRTCVFDRFKRKYCMENLLLRSQPRRSFCPLLCIEFGSRSQMDGMDFFSVSVFIVPLPTPTTTALPLCWLACS